MPYTYTIDVESNLLVATGTGKLTMEELASGCMGAVTDPRFKGDIRAFMDFSAVTSINFSWDVVKWRAEADRQHFQAGSRRALLVGTGFHEAVANIYKSASTEPDGGQVEVFADRAKALAWLNKGVPEDKALK